jgi:hypothetical protein
MAASDDERKSQLHQFFHVTSTQRICHVPPHTRQNNILREMRTLETHRHRLSPSLINRDYRGRSYPKSTQTKICDRALFLGWGVLRWFAVHVCTPSPALQRLRHDPGELFHGWRSPQRMVVSARTGRLYLSGERKGRKKYTTYTIAIFYIVYTIYNIAIARTGASCAAGQS